MYFIYISTLSFILFSLYNCFSNKKNKSIPICQYNQQNYSFLIKNIDFFYNDKCIECKNYNNYYCIQKNIELDVNNVYDFFVVTYIYNNTEYKYYSENKFLTFPMYSNDEIKNYVYINKINTAKLLITVTDENKINTIDEIDISPMLIEFLGPNYNFYKDLESIGIKLDIDKILTYLKIKCDKLDKLDKLDIINKNYKLLFYDNFNNEYNIDSNYLTWNPELKL